MNVDEEDCFCSTVEHGLSSYASIRQNPRVNDELGSIRKRMSCFRQALIAAHDLTRTEADTFCRSLCERETMVSKKFQKRLCALVISLHSLKP